MRPVRAALAATAVLATLAGCARPPVRTPSRLVVVTQVPAERAGNEPTPRSRYPDGSRIVILDLARPEVAPHVITGGLAAAGAPSVRADAGRIAFVGKETAAGTFAVWTCGPDGSGRSKAMELAADCGSAAFLPDGRVVASASTSAGGSALFVEGAKGGPPQRITFSGGTDVDPTLLRDGRIAFASRPAGAAEFALFAVHVDGTGVGPYCGPERRSVLLGDGPATFDAGTAAKDGGRRATECAEISARPKPQGHLSVVDPQKAWGTVFCVDARPSGTAGTSHVRFAALEGPPRPLGDVTLESDGSFFVRLPTDTPIVLDVVDDAGRVVASQRTPFWVRPGETRGCIGCHEDPDTTPPNVRPLAVLRETVPLAGVPATGAVR